MFRRRRRDPPRPLWDLRARLVTGDTATFGLAPSPRFPRVWAALMEVGVGEAEATLEFLDAVEAGFGSLEPIEELPLPATGEVRFNVLGFEGRRTTVAVEADVRRPGHALAQLYAAGQGVITQLRLTQEAAEQPGM